MEVAAERARVETEMQAAAVEFKAAQEEAARAAAVLQDLHIERLRVLAAEKIQGQVKMFLARKALRLRAYARYVKHFDPASGCYYYEERRSHKTRWTKPKALGAYDIDCDAAWVTMRDSVSLTILSSVLRFTVRRTCIA